MNTFYEHHKNSIRFQYRCFDRILLNGADPTHFSRNNVPWVSSIDTVISIQSAGMCFARSPHSSAIGVVNRSKTWGAPILDAPEGRRDEFVQRYFKAAKPDQVVCILKAREPARINDREWGRMFVRMCPYFPFSARVCLNQHYWIANRLQRRSVRFRLSTNAFTSCSDPALLQQIADSVTADDLAQSGRKWLTCHTPFFTQRERQHAGVEHRLFFSQVELCDNLIFSRRAAVDRLESEPTPVVLSLTTRWKAGRNFESFGLPRNTCAQKVTPRSASDTAHGSAVAIDTN